MSLLLPDLTMRLEQEIPPRNNIPASYSQVIRDAVADFGRRCPQQKIATLAVVSGTAAYALPADFQKVIKLESLSNPDGILINTAGFLVAGASSSFQERYTITDDTITFYPTPAYTLDRDLLYAAGYTLTDDSFDLPAATEDIVILKATALTLRQQANVAAREAWLYQQGDESVSKVPLPGNMRAAADDAEEMYMAAVKEWNGRALGSRATYSAYEGRGFIQ